MTIHHFTRENIDELKQILPKREWNILTRNAEDPDEPTDEELAYAFYKSPEGQFLQRMVKSRQFQQAKLHNEPLPQTFEGKPMRGGRAREAVQHLDTLIENNKIPEGLDDRPLYSGRRIDYGTSLIRSGKNPVIL
jgi:hypothetical protein